MKRNLGIGLGGCLSLGLLLLAPGTARAATISMSATSGSVVSVTVAVAGIEALLEPSLGAYDLDLSFDGAVLAFSSISFGSFLGGPADSFDTVSVTGGVVDFAELSLIFPNSLLHALQPDAFVLATILFDVLATEETLTSLALTQTILSDGNGQAIAVAAVAPLELLVAIPEVSGVHVFAIGLLVVLSGHALRKSRGLALRQGS